MALVLPPSVGILSELRATRSARKNANAPRGGQGFKKENGVKLWMKDRNKNVLNECLAAFSKVEFGLSEFYNPNIQPSLMFE